LSAVVTNKMGRLEVFSEMHSSKLILLVMAVVIASLVIDTSYLRIYTYGSNNAPVVNDRISIFVVLGIIYVIGQYLILAFVKNKQTSTSKQLRLSIIHKVVMAAQYSLGAVLVLIISEMVLTSAYSTLAIMVVLGISYSIAIVTLGLLSRRFFLWFRTNKNVVVLLYGLSAGMLAINASFTIAFVGDILLENTQPFIQSYVGGSFSPFIIPGSLADALNYPFTISSILSFMMTWVATILILRHYSPRSRRIEFQGIFAIPLIYFVLQFFPSFQNMITALPQSESTFFLYSFIFTFSKPVGGILFGIAFWVIARTLSQRTVVRNYMIVSAYGLILLFISNHAVLLVNITYPPFGLTTVSFMGLSSYLFLLGIYSSAISVSEDSKLRQSIRDNALQQSRLLDSIGTAQMEQEIQKKVLTLTKQNQDRMQEESGIESSLSEEDIKDYLKQVLDEVKKDHPQL
jgi:hypothetical protein